MISKASDNLLNKDSIMLEPDDDNSRKIRKDKDKESVILQAHEDFAPLKEHEDASVAQDKNPDASNELNDILAQRKTTKRREKRGKRGSPQPGRGSPSAGRGSPSPTPQNDDKS